VSLTQLKVTGAHCPKAIRATNLLVYRLFGDGRRRTKVIPCFGSEGSWFMLAFASLITASRM
jgi:hypothetical protein